MAEATDIPFDGSDSLQNVVNSAEAGDSITFNNNIIYKERTEITKNISINLNDAVFEDAHGSKKGVFYIKNQMSEIANGTFQNNSISGKSGYLIGGAIANDYGNINIKNVNFINNHLDGQKNYGGGAVGTLSGTTTIKNCEFKYNYVVGVGGDSHGHAVYENGGTTNIENSQFYYNGYRSTQLTFDTNVSGAVGGTGNATINITDSKFENNIAKRGGGLSFNDSTGTINGSSVEDMYFKNNTALGNGGAASLWSKSGKENSGALAISGKVEFEGNNALSNGGALAVETGNVTFNKNSKVIFTDNTAKTGGAIYNKTKCTINIDGEVIFSGNRSGIIRSWIDNLSDLPGAFSGISVNSTNATPNDIHNLGTVNINDGGVVTMDGGITGTGTVNIMGGGILYFGVEEATKLGDGTLALGKQYQVSGTLNVGNVTNPSPADAASTGPAVNFGSDSHLEVDGAIEGGALRSDDGGTVTVEDSAHLHINNAKVGKYLVTSGFTSAVINGNGWQSSNFTITTSNVLAEAEKAEVEGTNIVVNITAKEASTVLPDLIPLNNVDTMMANALNDTSDTAPAGIRMLSRALETTASPEAIESVNEVSRAVVTAGVQNTALRLADAASENVLNHLSLGNFDSGNSIHADGTDFWATPMYGNTYTSGMSASGASVRGNYGGIAFGADTQVGEVLGGKVRVGAALNGGGGKSETKGTATTTQNDYNFGGINLYAGWNKGNLNVIAGLGYGMGDNEVEMGLPASMEMGTAKADVDTSVITADLRAEYQLKTNWLDILPHAGVRYTSLRTDSHDLKVNGSVLNSVDAETQHIVQFPIGVTLTKNIDACGWNVKPQVDVSFIPAAGDKDMNTKVRFSGVDAVDSIETRIMDSTSWSGMAGIQASKGNLTFGLNYGIQASSHETDQRVQVSIGWKF